MATILEETINFIPSATMGLLEDTTFKATIISSINSSLQTLHQNAVGNPVDLTDNENLTWHDFLGSKYNPCAKQFVYLRAMIEFDPPAQTTLKTIEGLIDENLFRARVESEVIL